MQYEILLSESEIARVRAALVGCGILLQILFRRTRVMNLKINNLTKSYGHFNALSDVSFNVHSGETIGLLGRNGAGKTTTIKCIIGAIEPTKGNVSFNDGESKMSIGYLPEERGLYLSATVYEQLSYFADLNNLEKNKIKSQIEKYLSRFDIADLANKKIKTLSKGNQQKVQLISAILHEPDLLILDEPFSGLDPVNVELFKSIVNEEKSKGRIIILSSHRMEDIEELCDRVIMLKQGKMLINNTIDELIDIYSLKQQYYIESNADISELISNVKGLSVIESKGFYYTFKYETEDDIKKLQIEILNNGFELIKCGYPKITLHKIFVKELSDDEKE